MGWIGACKEASECLGNGWEAGGVCHTEEGGWVAVWR